MVFIDRLTQLNIMLWIHKNPIYRFINVYVGTIFMTIHMMFKYKFDIDIIHTKINLMKKDVKHKLEAEIIRNRELNQDLEELEKTRDAKIRSKRHDDIG